MGPEVCWGCRCREASGPPVVLIHRAHHAIALASLSELHDRALAAHRAGQLEEAEARYRELLALDERHPAVLCNLGLVLAAQRRYGDAVPYFERSLAARPDNANVLVALSNALNFCNRPAEAIVRCEAILARDPGHVDARHNKAVALRALNRHGEAIVELRALLARDPTDADAEYNLALSELAIGDYASGWRHYEARWRGSRAQPALPTHGIAHWRPGDDLRGRHLLIQAEQGLGDTLQYIRFIPLLASRCRAVLVHVPERLVPFVRRQLPFTRVDGLGSGLEGETPDNRIALLSLPLALNLDDEAKLAAPAPYLSADPQKVADWKARSPASGLRVGIAWRGSSRHRHDHNRSLAVTTLAPWLDAMHAAGASVVVLQKDVTGEERAWLARFPRVLVDDAANADFDATAAVIASLDHIVSVDTAVAHLAGGMARPCTVLLSFAADWRWRLGRDTTPLYARMRLLRQRVIADWTAPVEELVASAALW